MLIGPPAGQLSKLVQGDIVVAVIWNDTNGVNVVAPNGSWTKLDSIGANTTGRTEWWSHTVLASDGMPYKFQAAQSVTWRAMFLGFRNASSIAAAGPAANPLTPLEEAQTGTYYQLPGSSTSKANQMVLYMGAFVTNPGPMS